MDKVKKHWSTLVLGVLSGLVLACGSVNLEDRLSQEVVEAHTSGLVSREEAIQVVFAQDVKGSPHLLQGNAPLSFSPSLQGSWEWKGDDWVVFTPDSPMTSGQIYTASLEPQQLHSSWQEMGGMHFHFQVMPQTLQLGAHSLEIAQGEVRLESDFSFSDVISQAELQERLSLRLGSEPLPFTLQELGSGTWKVLSERFEQQANPQNLHFSLSGLSEGDPGYTEDISVPGDQAFELLAVRAVKNELQYIELEFSGALDDKQDLTGLITTEDNSGIVLDRDKNTVRVFPKNRFPRSVKVQVARSVQSEGRQNLGTDQTFAVVFPQEKPGIEFPTGGVIFPPQGQDEIPIRIRNLNSIMIQVTEIFPNNIPQFFQVNNYNGSQELNRVGQVVYKKIIPLGWDDSLADQWQTVGLDLSDLMAQRRNGFFQLNLEFRPWMVEGEDPPVMSQRAQEVLESWQEDPWSGAPYIYSYGDHREYWDYGKHPVFYRRNSYSWNKTVFVSNIGVMAKKADSGAFHLFATDLLSAEPLPGALVEVLDYAQQTLLSQRTDNQGYLQIPEMDTEPYLAIVKKNGQVSYLRMQDGEALSTSFFDVGGARPVQGIDGFVYAERGVWRPGDDIHLGFVLLDEKDVLPRTYPVHLEVTDARGKLAYSETINEGVGDLYYFKVPTATQAPTGNWTARVLVGDRSFQKSLKIETVMPNRLKIELDFPELEEGEAFRGRTILRLFSQWLHGAPAPGYRADVGVSFVSKAPSFNGFADYTFLDPGKEYSGSNSKVFEGNLDDEGYADISIDPAPQRTAPGMLRANFFTRVYEPGGGVFSSSSSSRDYHPYERYAGVKVPVQSQYWKLVYSDRDQEIPVALVDTDGQGVSGEVTVEFYQIDWWWWWENGVNSLPGYINRQGVTPYKKETVQINRGKGVYQFQKESDMWGRYYIRVKDANGAHSTGEVVYMRPQYWWRNADAGSAEAPNVLVLTTDQRKYSVGDQVKVTIPSGQRGKVLATVESGGEMIAQEWIDVAGGELSYRFRATESMAPNAYVHIHYLQPHADTENSLPIRSYGIIPVLVENNRSRLAPQLEVPEQFRPGLPAEFTVREAQGRAMSYTVAVVDEGLLGITNYRTPDPWDHFYKKRSSLMSTWDMYDYVAGAFGGQFDTILNIGGGDGGDDQEGGRKANRFKPVVQFFEPRSLAAGESDTLSFIMPEYVGAVRVMLVAREEKSFGVVEEEVPVKNELMVQGSLPRVLSPGDVLDIPVNVFALDDRVKNVTVNMEVLEGPVSLRGASRDVLSFTRPEEKVANFSIKVEEAVGFAKVRFTAQGNGFSAQEIVEIDVRIPGDPIQEVFEKSVGGNQTWSSQITALGYEGTNRAYLEVSSIPPLNLGERLNYLIRYPYGCIEQTTSSVFPQVYLDDVVTLSDKEKADLDRNIAAGIERLKSFQISSGAFAYWPGNTGASLWGTNYAGHFLLEAKARGYSVPEDMLGDWINYQKNQANSFTPNNSTDNISQAYRLYTLARAGEPQLGAMNRLREVEELKTVARWRLANAYALAGQLAEARRLVRGLDADIGFYRETGQSYGSDVRDKAMILETMVGLDMSEESFPLARELSQIMNDGRWYSTQTTAYTIMALAKFGVYAASEEELRFEFSWAGGETQQVRTNKPMDLREINVDGAEDKRFVFKNNGSQPLFPRLVVQGVPKVGGETNQSATISLEVSYDYPVFREGEAPFGEDLKVTMTVRNRTRQRLDELVLNYTLPSGWEILNDRLTGVDSNNDYDYMDIRDDRIYTFFDLSSRQSKTLYLHSPAGL
jgi:uncharacterized protein YfaS (alpha-2-macroglobulin family)